MKLREVKISSIRPREVGDPAFKIEVTIDIHFEAKKDNLTLKVYMPSIPDEKATDQNVRALEKAYDLLAFVPDKEHFWKLAQQYCH